MKNKYIIILETLLLRYFLLQYFHFQSFWVNTTIQKQMHYLEELYLQSGTDT